MKKLAILMGSVAMMAVVLAGCATGASPEEAVAAQLEAFKQAMLAEDIDAIMATYSDDFEHYEWGDKEGARDFMQQAIDMGYTEGMEVITEDAEIVLQDDGSAQVYPVDLSGAFGTVTLELTFADKDGEWLITGLDATGI